jgi:glycosyltransferase involved in cell wall biosynthesis
VKLSFVIPAYNEEKYIGQCLSSIQKELSGKDYDVEIIVVNNASTDQTHEVVSSFEGVKVVHESQKGLVSARRAGYAVSTGHLIANVDADTRLPKGWIDKVFSEFSQDENLAALSGPYLYYDLSWWRLGLVKFFYYAGFIYHALNHFIFRNGAMLQGGNFIVRRTHFEKAGEFNSQFDFYGEDTDVARRIQKVGKVKFTFSLPMYTSGRRLTKEGLLIAGTRYAINHFWVLLFKKPFTKTFKDVRN